MSKWNSKIVLSFKPAKTATGVLRRGGGVHRMGEYGNISPYQNSDKNYAGFRPVSIPIPTAAKHTQIPVGTR